MSGGPHASAMGFIDHASINVPAPERSRLDVLGSEGLGKVHGSFYVVRIGLGLDPAPLLFIEGPITVKLKSAVTDARAWKHSSCNGVRISYQGSHRRSLIANGGDTEIKKSRKQIRPITVRVEIYKPGNDHSPSSIQNASAVSLQTAGW